MVPALLVTGVAATAVAYTYLRNKRKRRQPGKRAGVTPENVKQALRDNGGNVKHAAKSLGVAEKTVHYALNRNPDLREQALGWRLEHSRTGRGRPPYKHGRF